MSLGFWNSAVQFALIVTVYPRHRPADLLQKVNLSDQKKRKSPLNPTVNHVTSSSLPPNDQIPESVNGHRSDNSIVCIRHIAVLQGAAVHLFVVFIQHLSSIGSSVASVDSKQPYIYPLTALHDQGDLHGGVNPGFDDLAFQEQMRGTSGYHPPLDQTDTWTGLWQ